MVRYKTNLDAYTEQALLNLLEDIQHELKQREKKITPYKEDCEYLILANNKTNKHSSQINRMLKVISEWNEYQMISALHECEKVAPSTYIP